MRDWYLQNLEESISGVQFALPRPGIPKDLRLVTGGVPADRFRPSGKME